MPFEIKTMDLADVERALSWARAEGWNPGVDDAAAFHAAAPEDFLMGWLDGTPITAISVVRYGAEAGFLGLYLCQPDYRGQGFGWATWQAGLAHLGGRLVGLDGVLAQQENYARSGFAKAYRNIRMVGQVGAGALDGTPLRAEDFPSALALDQRVTGLLRPDYMQAWLQESPSRKTLVVKDSEQVVALGTIRRCDQGCKIGPLYAPNATVARALIGGLSQLFPGEDVVLDVPEPNAAALRLAEELGLTPVFETARMYRGTAPQADIAQLFGQATLELG